MTVTVTAPEIYLHENKQLQPGVDETVILLKDDKYPVEVKLHFIAYPKENIIKEYAEISHQEKKLSPFITMLPLCCI